MSRVSDSKRKERFEEYVEDGEARGRGGGDRDMPKRFNRDDITSDLKAMGIRDTEQVLVLTELIKQSMDKGGRGGGGKRELTAAELRDLTTGNVRIKDDDGDTHRISGREAKKILRKYEDGLEKIVDGDSDELEASRGAEQWFESKFD
jgi:hypothetical protein